MASSALCQPFSCRRLIARFTAVNHAFFINKHEIINYLLTLTLELLKYILNMPVALKTKP